MVERFDEFDGSALQNNAYLHLKIILSTLLQFILLATYIFEVLKLYISVKISCNVYGLIGKQIRKSDMNSQ